MKLSLKGLAGAARAGDDVRAGRRVVTEVVARNRRRDVTVVELGIRHSCDV